MKTGILLLCALMFLASGARAGTVSLEPDEIASLRTLVATNNQAGAEFAALRRTADAALTSQPRPIVRVITEGRLAGDPKKVQTGHALQDMPKIEALGWAAVVTGDDRYAAKAREFILAWARVNQSDGDAINETVFEPLIVAYDSLRGTFAPDDRQVVDAWLRKKADTLWHDHRGLKNNWYSHRLKIAGLIALTVGDRDFFETVMAAARRHIGGDFDADGSSYDFHQRDALHYHLYTVEPLLTLARASARSGEDLFDYQAPNGGSLRGGVDFVVPFATGQKTHREFVNSRVSFDRKRAQNGQADYQPHDWEPRGSIGMFAQAAWFRPAYGELAARLAGRPGEKYLDWRMVVDAVSRHS